MTGMQRMNTVNMARIRSCELLEEYDPASVNVPKGHLKELTLLLHDKRNGLERVLLHFILKRKRRSWTSGYIESHSNMTGMMKQSY